MQELEAKTNLHSYNSIAVSEISFYGDDAADQRKLRNLFSNDSFRPHFETITKSFALITPPCIEISLCDRKFDSFLTKTENETACLLF